MLGENRTSTFIVIRIIVILLEIGIIVVYLAFIRYSINIEAFRDSQNPHSIFQIERISGIVILPVSVNRDIKIFPT